MSTDESFVIGHSSFLGHWWVISGSLVIPSGSLVISSSLALEFGGLDAGQGENFTDERGRAVRIEQVNRVSDVQRSAFLRGFGAVAAMGAEEFPEHRGDHGIRIDLPIDPHDQLMHAVAARPAETEIREQ